MQSRFIPKIFAKNGLTEQDVRDEDCASFLLSRYSFRSSTAPEIAALAHAEWDAQDFSSSTSWARWFNPLPDKKFVDFMQNKLQGETLVDIGGGAAVMSFFAFLFRARNYVNVDMGFLSRDSYQALTYGEVSRFMPYQWTDRPALRQHIDLDPEHSCTQVNLKMDMLEFLSRLPDNSLPIATMNGIDHCIIHTAKYAEELNWQIRRTLKVGGILFGNNSCIYDLKRLGQSECLRRVELELPYGEGFILQKEEVL